MELVFSVIIPVYNTKQYLSTCVDSVLEQDFSSYEIILVDDGSTDGSGAMCDAYGEMDDKIRVIHQKNGGLSAARNAGIAVSNGDYLLFVDSDDVLLGTDALTTLAATLHAYTPDVLLYLPKEYDADLANVVTEHTPFCWDDAEAEKSAKIIDELYREAGIYVTMAPTKSIRRRFCVDNQLLFTPGIYHEDDEWIARVFLANPQIAFSPLACYGYRHRDNSIITTANQQTMLKKANDRMRIALGLLNIPAQRQYPHMYDYFINYYIGAYTQALDGGKEDVIRSRDIPFHSFCFSASKKVRLLGYIKRLAGYRMAEILLRKYLLCKK